MQKQTDIEPLYSLHHMLFFRRCIISLAIMVFIQSNWSYNFDTFLFLISLAISHVTETPIDILERKYMLSVVTWSLARFGLVFVTAYFAIRIIDLVEPRICETQKQISRKRRRNRRYLRELNQLSELLDELDNQMDARIKDRQLICAFKDALRDAILKIENLDIGNKSKSKSTPTVEPPIDLLNYTNKIVQKPKSKRFVPNLLLRSTPPKF